jgi:transcriptional regulator with XRE-family HTH domain
MNEKIEFSNRLRQAMADAGYAASPSVLEQEFNLRWYGRSISNQAAWNWLNSKAVPTQDKIQVLAEWLKVEPEVLRFGEAVRHSVQEYRQRWDEGVGYLERETFDAFLQLPAPQRKLIREVILTFAQVHGGAPRGPAAGETQQK